MCTLRLSDQLEKEIQGYSMTKKPFFSIDQYKQKERKEEKKINRMFFSNSSVRCHVGG